MILYWLRMYLESVGIVILYWLRKYSESVGIISAKNGLCSWVFQRHKRWQTINGSDNRRFLSSLTNNTPDPKIIVEIIEEFSLKTGTIQQLLWNFCFLLLVDLFNRYVKKFYATFGMFFSNNLCLFRVFVSMRIIYISKQEIEFIKCGEFFSPC